MIVLDASALIDVVLDQPPANWVLDQIAGEEIAAPAHQAAEVLSALSRLVRAGALDAVAAQDALDEALSLPQQVAPLAPDHIRRAFDLRERIHVLDGIYIALAEDLECAMVTTDLRLERAGAPCEVRTPD